MDRQQLAKFLEIATEAAQKGGTVLEKYWGKPLNIQEKLFSGNLVTDADKESENVILSFIKDSCPTHSILSEEAGLTDTGESAFSWVVDPLDGTTNYTHQYPMVSISIALVHEDTPIVGVIYNPIRKELFQAAAGIKSTLNGRPIQVSKVATLPRSLLATGFAYDRRETADNNYTEFCHMTHLSQGVRREGSAALDLAYVACGRLDGYWERGLNPWDIAAGIILIEEAGGEVSSYEGDPLILETGRILASNGLIHDELIQELQNVSDGRAQTYY